MAIDAKVSFLNQVRKALEATVTVEVMNNVVSAVLDVLERFEMDEIIAAGEEASDLLDSYLDALKVQGRSLKTIDQYKYVIEKMLGAVKVPVRQITVYHLRKYLAFEKERGVADTTLEGKRQVFSAFFNWLKRENLIERNPVMNLGAIKCAKRQKKIYSEVDIERLNSSCKTLRDRVIINFLGATGCRVSEAMDLNRSSVDLIRMECIVRGKGNKERTVFLDPVTAMLLRRYLDSRKDHNEALFVGLRGERLQPNGVRYMMRELAKRAGVEHVHPHKFRRTLATNLTRHGMPIQEVANVLGHEKLDTTMRYVVLDGENIRNSYRRYAS